MNDARDPDAQPPSDAATLERCCRLVEVELQAAALQRRRLQTTEPEDDSFDLRWWIDLQFFILALWRLRRAAGLLGGQAFQWLQKDDNTRHELNVDTALDAAQALQRVLQETKVIAAMPKCG